MTAQRDPSFHRFSDVATDLDDRELTLAFQRGAKGAYQAIYDRYSTRIDGICRRMLQTPEDAQEAAQETFLKVYQALGRFNGRYQLGAWITRIATNVCLDHLRARNRTPTVAGDAEKALADTACVEDLTDPASLLVKRDESVRVRELLASLPPLHRAALVLRDYEGLSYSEIASILDISDGQVKALIHRSRRNFRRWWAPAVESLIPARLLQKFRDLGPTTKEQMVHAAAVQSAPVASVCSGLLQQCGSFVAERVVPFAATLVLGGTAAFASPAPPLVAPVEATVQPASPRSEHQAMPGSKFRGEGNGEMPTDGVSSPPAPAGPEDESAAPGPEPSPAETPTPTPTPTPTADQTPAPTPTEPPAEGEPASPLPVTATYLFDQGQTPTTTTVATSQNSADCSTRSFRQVFSTTISDSSGSYPIDVRIDAGSMLQIEFTVHKNGSSVYYSGSATPKGGSASPDRVNLVFNGRYGTGPTAAESAGLPVNGSIRGEFSLDCHAHAVVAESVVFTTQ